MRDFYGRECECAACNMRRWQDEERAKQGIERFKAWLETDAGKAAIQRAKLGAQSQEPSK